MSSLTSSTKIEEVLSSCVAQIEALKTYLNKVGNLYLFEEKMSAVFTEMYNTVVTQVLQEVAEEQQTTQKAIASIKRLGKLVVRTSRIQIRTGHYVEIENLYAKKVPKGYVGSRHLMDLAWRIEKGASPVYYSTVAMFSVLCPSFEIASQILDNQKIANNLDRVKKLTLHIGSLFSKHQAPLTRQQGETLKGKRVIIGIDGGRTRMRLAKESEKEGEKGYTTPWNEPKMFVIEVLNEKGEIDYKNLPIYGTVFGCDEIVELLASHLKGLSIEAATQIQIVADGAPWIWNRIKPMLLKLGVPEHKIVETLDYYHAVAHLNPIVEAMSKKNKENKTALLKDFKNLLFNGQIQDLIKKVKASLKKLSQEVKTAIAYFENHKDRMQYAQNKANKLVCGSGIIESGIRRVINLRFKNASSFWKPHNVQGLYFLRGILLAFRWKTMMNNFVNL